MKKPAFQKALDGGWRRWVISLKRYSCHPALLAGGQKKSSGGVRTGGKLKTNPQGSIE
jgi:hypothetical protein